MQADKSNNYGYNKNLQPNANRLRKSMTKSEACLWKFALRARKMKGYQFRRQRPALYYICDFMCKELMLVIEVDGITHLMDCTIKKDKIKQSALEAAGFTLLRFTAKEVLRDIGYVIKTIERWIGQREGYVNGI
jgi:very-short-patch-repair endonuclease